MYKLLLRCITLVLLVAGPVWAQDRQIGGIVRDDQGQPQPGVNVQLKGSTRGTTTDASGTYRINVGGTGTLVFSSIGFASQEVPFTDATSQLNVNLITDNRQLSEVVVTALGIEKSAKTLTYAAQQIDGTRITQVRDANFVNTLSGKIAGLQVVQGAGGVGSAARVTLRGNRSLNGTNNALIVVDGVVYDNSNGGQVGSDFGGFNGSDGAANINPDDIESVNVLKGAAGSVLYGSRAANGVMIITTKRGKAGRISVDVNSGVVSESPMLLPELQNTFTQGAGGVSNATASGSWGARGTTYPNNVRDFFRNGVSTNNSIGVSGGTDKMQTYLSYTHNYNQGLIPNNDLTRHTFNLRLSNQFSSRFSTEGKITYMLQDIGNKIKVGEESGIVMNIYKIPRSIDLESIKTFETPDGVPNYWTSSSIYMNPYWTINRTINSEKRNRVTMLGQANYKLTDWLTLTGRISVDRFFDRNLISFYNRTLLFAGNGGTFEAFDTQNLEQNIDLFAQGNNNITKDLKVNYTVGAQFSKRFNQLIGARAFGLQIPNKFDLGFARALQPRSGLSQRQVNGVFVSSTFSFRDYLILDLTARNDWSSTLPAPHSYFYPSVGLTAILSDMINLPDAISFAKVRAAYTRVGNDASPYLLQQTYSFSQGGVNGFIQRDATQAIPDLKPELTNSLEIGLDWRFVGNRFGVDFTYYKTNTINQLLTLGLAPASGFSSQYVNSGDIQNTGFEVALTAKPLTGAFSWDVTLNASRNVNKIVSLHPDIKKAPLAGGFGRTSTPIVAEGGSYGDIETQLWQRDAQGRFVVDASGKPVVTTAQLPIGNFNPKFLLGLQNTFNYRNFTLGVLFDGRFGGVMTSGTEANLAFDGNAAYTEANRAGNWVLPGVTATGETNTKAINAETFWTTVSGGRYSWGEFFTYDATNVRLRELTFGYGFNLPSTFFIKRARLSVVGRNLFFVYRGKAVLDIPGVPTRRLSFDPDISLGAGNFQGVEYGNVPASRSVGVNLQLSF
ncbi:SusC/RagA family TonB-linked outer membrane protein [Spirosoma montaniterrae]|uniref:SusC/RagA family TonB-linked outer membrane protein n=1 Tax=Spirosoma montaniterrae TaxID=1178516 RepID=A0A1P9WXD4_9BACT|nr:SusC/RagA family TonB-linked outer membrane protein [Spirosoma montaniterrae]AQG80056.1 SusC/RagA family TonB-linked outer membrane protein [Spirosoma montaniterrae]